MASFCMRLELARNPADLWTLFIMGKPKVNTRGLKDGGWQFLRCDKN